MLALGRGGVQIIGQARWTGLGRRWVAKYYLIPLCHDELIGHDDHEIHDRHENDEVDDRGNERSELQICGIATAVDQLPAQARPLNAALRRRARDGGLLSYGPDNADIFRRAASYVDRILRGANPAELPVQVPIKFERVINLKTAKTLGLTVPLTLQVAADEVIE